MGIRDRFINFIIGDTVNKRINMAVAALDDPHDRQYSENPRDRYSYDRESILKDALEAWRVNPLARRIVELTSQYVVGSGLAVSCDHKPSHDFLQEWFNHRLNNLAIRSFEWCDELTRSGELFIAVSTDAAGMSYVRAIPALEIESIKSRENDVEQEITYYQKATVIGEDPKPWAAYNEETDDGESPVMFHYAINRPVGAQRGESDLSPLLRWLSRYGSWLEDRVRLNRFRQAFVYVVRGTFQNEADRLNRQREINANPPTPGTVMVLNTGESWEVIEPKLASGDAEKDGLALKKMIASGAGIPMHFLAEPEGSTRTTAEASGGPTFRHYDQRQQFFFFLLRDLAVVALKRRARKDRRLQAGAEVKASGTDISGRDNGQLAQSAQLIVASFISLRARGLLDDKELLRLAYKFAGEVVDIEQVLKAGKQADLWVADAINPISPLSPSVNTPALKDPTGKGTGAGRVKDPSNPEADTGEGPELPQLQG